MGKLRQWHSGADFAANVGAARPVKHKAEGPTNPPSPIQAPQALARQHGRAGARDPPSTGSERTQESNQVRFFLWREDDAEAAFVKADRFQKGLS
jgi:hypothetical protein